MSLIPLDGSYEQHMISSQALGPLSTVTVLPRRPRRGGRKATALPKKESRRNIDPLLSNEARRRNAALARKLGACSRCEKQRIRCLIDPDDHLGPCLTCIRSQKLCPRFEAQQSSGTLVTQLMPHHYDVYRVLVKDEIEVNFDVEDPIAREAFDGDIERFLFQNPKARYPEHDYSESKLISAILLIYGSSNDLLWNTFRVAFKMAFNPIWAAKSQALKSALYLWFTDVIYNSQILRMNTALETVRSTLLIRSGVRDWWEFAEARDPKLHTRPIFHQLALMVSYDPEYSWQNWGLQELLEQHPDVINAIEQLRKLRFQFGVRMTLEREQLAMKEDKLSRLFYYMSYFVYKRTCVVDFYRDNDLGCPEEYIDLMFADGVDEIEL